MPTITAPVADAPPPPFTVAEVFTQLHPDSLIAVFLLVAAGVYLYATYRLRARGDHWPPGRTIAFVGGGLGSIAAVTVTGVETYDTSLLSVHMVLTMVAPIFLALGAPVTLAVRTLPARPRGVLLAVLHSRVARVLTFPLVAFALFVANPFVLYFTDLYRLTLQNSLAHELVHVHFIVTGCLFFWPLLGLDPVPNRWPYPGRALLMVLSVPFHTVLGLTIMQSRTLLGGDWYPSLGLTWSNPFDDQRVAGGILWAGGELVSITMLGVLILQWIRQSEREARRTDRALDRAEAEERARTTAADAVVAPAARTTREDPRGAA